jgi:hypothetical protein
VRVDLSALTFIDGDGKALIGQMYKERTELVASGCLNKYIVEEVMQSECPKCNHVYVKRLNYEETEEQEMNKPTYEELKDDLIKHPNRIVFIKDFGPALFQEQVKTPTYQRLVFQNYFRPKLKTTITPYNFGQILTNISEANPELQFSLAYSEILVGDLTESVASKHEGSSHAPSNGEGFLPEARSG